MREEFQKALDILIDTTTKKELTEMSYSLKEAEIMFSAEMNGCKNQSERDAKVKILMEKEYIDLVNVRTDAKIAYYRWATLKTLLENK